MKIVLDRRSGCPHVQTITTATQTEIPLLDNVTHRVREWSIRVVPHTTGAWAYCVRITHDGGTELWPGWMLTTYDLEGALRTAKRMADWLHAN